jgi:hypothetical protein
LDVDLEVEVAESLDQEVLAEVAVEVAEPVANGEYGHFSSDLYCRPVCRMKGEAK